MASLTAAALQKINGRSLTKPEVDAMAGFGVLVTAGEVKLDELEQDSELVQQAAEWLENNHGTVLVRGRMWVASPTVALNKNKDVLENYLKTGYKRVHKICGFTDCNRRFQQAGNTNVVRVMAFLKDFKPVSGREGEFSQPL